MSKHLEVNPDDRAQILTVRDTLMACVPGVNPLGAEAVATAVLKDLHEHVKSMLSAAVEREAEELRNAPQKGWLASKR